jgi:hypothetical protein
MSLQRAVCDRYKAAFDPIDSDSKVGVALSTLDQFPLNALRHRPEGGTCGWYVWGGEFLSEEPDFFEPLHAMHLEKHCPELIPYLALPPGWRVLLAPNQEEVWYDSALLAF